MFDAKHSSLTRGRKRSKITNFNDRPQSAALFSLFKTQLEVFRSNPRVDSIIKELSIFKSIKRELEDMNFGS